MPMPVSLTLIMSIFELPSLVISASISICSSVSRDGVSDDVVEYLLQPVLVSIYGGMSPPILLTRTVLSF